jgi:Family of unknown function (DUF6900)
MTTEALLARIAHAHITTLQDRANPLETQDSDREDFIDVAVWEIKAALEEAYNCGRADAAKA